jgi:hypothetical protein
MHLKDAAKAGREWHFKHAIVYLDKALNKIEQQRPQLKQYKKLQQAIDKGMRSVTIRGFSFGSLCASDIELKRKEIRKDLRNFSEKLTEADPLLRKVFFQRVDKIETLDNFFHEAVEDVPVTHANVFVLLALVARCALHRWATTVCDWKKMLCCTMCSRVAGGCGALKRGVGIAGEAVVAAARWWQWRHGGGGGGRAVGSAAAARRWWLRQLCFSAAAEVAAQPRRRRRWRQWRQRGGHHGGAVAVCMSDAAQQRAQARARMPITTRSV